MTHNKSRKRSHVETTEFMPLSKSKLFESDDDATCEYDWGFKKTDTNASKDNEVKKIKSKDEHNEKCDTINRKFAYKFTNPVDLKDEDREIYMTNLRKIYSRSCVYIPSFYELDNVLQSTNKLIDNGINAKLREDLAIVTKQLEKFWQPLYEHYVQTERLPCNCSASKLISRCHEQFTRAKGVYESCIKDGIKSHASSLKPVLTELENKEIESIINIFKAAVGDVLLVHASDPTVSLDQMSTDSNRLVFNRMVKDDLEMVKSRVKASNPGTKKSGKSAKRAKKSADSEQESEEEEEEAGAAADQEVAPENRPASKELLANRGLVPRRKKVDSNPRVKHRMKFKKAVVRYHSQVARSRDDMNNYSGEQSGIRIGVIKAKKIK